MVNMSKIKISIPEQLFNELTEAALEQQVSKDELIEKALIFYLEKLDKESYAKSFQRAAKDKELLEIAEEGMKEYFEMLRDFDESDESEKKNKY
jgi:metal-responsive CopG/Arc/MetJ family transcriptional regulator